MAVVCDPARCPCSGCRAARVDALMGHDPNGRRAYFEDMHPYPRFGPTRAERRQRDLDEDARALENDLWLMRHGSTAALGRVVERINRHQ